MISWNTRTLKWDEPDWPTYPRILVAEITLLQSPWFAACRIVREIWSKYPGRRISTRDVETYRESIQRLALDIEIGRAELAYERSLAS
jgi:hypothetical protein